MFALPKFTWDEDKKLCKKCAHLREYEKPGVTIMKCAASPFVNGSCSDNRNRGKCGKDGAMFMPRELLGIVSLDLPVLSSRR